MQFIPSAAVFMWNECMCVWMYLFDVTAFSNQCRAIFEPSNTIYRPLCYGMITLLQACMCLKSMCMQSLHLIRYRSQRHACFAQRYGGAAFPLWANTLVLKSVILTDHSASASAMQASNRTHIVCNCFNLLIKFWGRKAMSSQCKHSVSNLTEKMNNVLWLVRCSNCFFPLPVCFIFIMSFSFPWNLWHIHQHCDKLDVQWNGVWLRAVED